jgi:Skp family chaperone for outer membrane proteins
MSKILLAAAILAVSVAPMAQAADAPKTKTPAAPPAGEKLGGPLIKGVCFLSRQAVAANAKVGVAVAQRIAQLKAQAQAEVDAKRGPIDADARALQADAAKTPAPSAADIERRRAAIQVRYQALQSLVDERNREIQATEAKALSRVSAEMQPLLIAAYKAHGCGLLFDRNAVIDGNMGEDLTAEMVKDLDAKITTLTFDREVLPPAATK